VIDIELPQVVRFERPPAANRPSQRPPKLLSKAKFPVILNGAGVVLAGAIDLDQAGRAARCPGLLELPAQ
jgi:sulfoacetaldehyde acetyltransferase